MVPKHYAFQHMEQAVNNILMLKEFIGSINTVWQAMSTVIGNELLQIKEVRSINC